MNKSLEEIIKSRHGVSDEDYADAVRLHAEKGGRLTDVLMLRKVITETQLLDTLSEQYDIPFWPELPLESFGEDRTRSAPIGFLKRHAMVPLVLKNIPAAGVTVLPEEMVNIIAVNDPAAFEPLDDLARIIGFSSYNLVISTKSAIFAAINLIFDMSRGTAEQLVQHMEEDGSTIISEIEDTADLLDDTSDAPIIKLVNHIISQSIKARASDIHIEPYQDSFKVRYRVDGILYDLLTPPKWIQASLISRIKVMAKLDIAEKRLPQDGRLEVKIGSQNIDVRVSTLPTTFGERVVMRLLNKSEEVLNLKELGLSSEDHELFNQLVTQPNGIILVTGPTGSGKTTTLYSVLASIIKPDINIITIEDPVEYQLKGISQIQVNPKIDLTFARGLRAIVRQDPDVILIGEIRDKETASIAVQSALTGHLVFSTLHTNDSAGAITRLVDIGVEPFLISSAVVAVIAQRLVRVLCDHCKEAYTPGVILESIGISRSQLGNHTIYQANGCEKCFNTGYRGRIAIFEIMHMREGLKNLILKTFDATQIRQFALQYKMKTLRQSGIEKVLAGATTIEEVLRVTQQGPDERIPSTFEPQ